MQRHRIIDFRPDLVLAQEFSQLVALLHTDDILMRDMEGLFRRMEQSQGLRCSGVSFSNQTSSAKQAVVFFGIVLAMLVPALDIFHLHAQHRRLHGVETAVPADLVVVITLLAAMICERAHVVGNGVIIRRYQPAIAIRAQIFGRIKTESRR